MLENSSPTQANNNLTSPSNGGIITPNYKFTEDTNQKFRTAFTIQYNKAVDIIGEINTINTVGVLYTNRLSEVYGEYDDNTRIIKIRNADRNDFIATMTEICKSHKESGQWSTLQENTLIDCPYKYDRNHNRILYNPKIESFSRYDPIESILHESAHAIDSTYYKSFANLSFSQNIIDTMMILDKKGLYNTYTNSALMKNSYLSDIISALTENDPMFFLCGYHENKYWKIPGNREAEIFANIFILQAQNNTEAIDFIKNHFSDVYDAFMTIIGG